MNPLQTTFKSALEFRTDNSHLLVLKLKFLVHFFIFLQCAHARAAIVGLVIADIFAYTGAWQNIWLLFGGSNQLLAGLALTLVTIYLAKLKKPTAYTFWPAIFMIITCEAALLFESAVFFRAVAIGKPLGAGMMLKYPGIALTLNAIFGIVGLVLFVLGLVVAYDGLKRYSEYRKAASKTS